MRIRHGSVGRQRVVYCSAPKSSSVRRLYETVKAALLPALFRTAGRLQSEILAMMFRTRSMTSVGGASEQAVANSEGLTVVRDENTRFTCSLSRRSETRTP